MQICRHRKWGVRMGRRAVRRAGDGNVHLGDGAYMSSAQSKGGADGTSGQVGQAKTRKLSAGNSRVAVGAQT